MLKDNEYSPTYALHITIAERISKVHVAAGVGKRSIKQTKSAFPDTFPLI